MPPTECQLWLHCLVWEKNEVGRDRTGQRQNGLEEIMLTLYLGPFVCRDRLSASRSLTVCLTRTPWYTLLEYSKGSRTTVGESPLDTKPETVWLHTNFHPSPQMCVHLNVSQFYSYRRMTLWDWCVNVMEIAFGLVNANGLLKKRQFTTNTHSEGGPEEFWKKQTVISS